jgi:N utilization substance protein A
LSLAIGRRGQNVRLASKLSGWDIEIMTAEELEEQIERAVAGFCELEGMTEELAQSLVEQGYLSYDDLEVIEPDALQEMGGLTEEQVELIVNQAEERARKAEVAAAEERRQRKLDKVEEEMRAAAEADARKSSPQPVAESEVPAAEGEVPAAQGETPVAEGAVPAAQDGSENRDQDGDAIAT